MRRNILFYLISFSMLVVIFLFFSRAYTELMTSAELANRANTIYSNFQGLSKEINNAAIAYPKLNKSLNIAEEHALFAADKQTIIKQIEQLRSGVLDTANVRITTALEHKIKTEIDWLLTSNVPDSILNHRSAAHVAEFKSINALINEGVNRNLFLHERRKKLLSTAIYNVRIWMISFIICCGIALFYTTLNLFRQKSKTARKEGELQISNRLLKNAQSLGSIGNWEYNVLTNKLFWSDELFNIWNVSKNAYQPSYQIFFDTVHPEDRDKVQEAYDIFFTGETGLDLEHRIILPDNTIKWVHEMGRPILDEQGRSTSFEGTVQDISAQKKVEENLEKSERRFRKLIENSNDIIAMLDEKLIPFYRSPATKRLTGHIEGDDERLKTEEVHPEDRPKMLDLLQEMKGNPGQVSPITYRIKHKNGHYIWLEGTFTNMLHEPGIEAIVLNMRDVTARIKSEEEIITAYKEKEIVLNRINDAVISLDNEWRYTFLNDIALRVHPLGKASVLGKTIWEVNPQLQNTPFRDKYHEAMRTREVVEIEEYYPPYDVWYSLKIYPSTDGLTVFYKDISETKKAEKSLLQSLKEIKDYKHALDESAIVAITDQKGIITHVNNNFCKISKYSREELIGKDHRIINSGYHSKEFIRDIWVTIANGKIWTGDLKNKAKDGSTYWVETTIVPFLDEKGKPYQYIAIRADITQRKETEEQLSKNLTELERSNKELEQFAYIASHDLQEPLRMVGSYMQLIERRYKGQLDDDADEFIHFAIDGARRMKQLIADLLNYSRLNREGESEVININDIMEDVTQNLAASIQDTAGIINYKDLPLIRADKTQMTQLFQNLISNALKFKKDDVTPVITVNAERQSGNWLFTISDNGIGIEPQYAEKVFVIFKQLHSKLKYSGTGIGLAIAKKIVEKHGGNIWFTSEPGQGTTFHFTLKI